MNDREAQEERADLISRTFALITAKCEDAATLAAESQGRQPSEVLRENAEKLRDLMSQTSTVIDCITATAGSTRSLKRAVRFAREAAMKPCDRRPLT